MSAPPVRMPAEWQPHAATWIAWPHHLADWPGRFAPIPWVYAEIVRALGAGETVRLLVDDQTAERRARRVLARAHAPLDRVEIYRIPTDRVWARDWGPIFVREPDRGGLAVAGFAFNGWARYPDHRRDELAARRIAGVRGVPVRPVEVDGRRFVLEGGSIDVNGRGSLVTTEECLLDTAVQVRNPGLDRAAVERVLADALGATNVLWLGRGICGDDTHGHVDDLCRFVGPRTVVLCREDDPRDANYRALEENRERLEGCRRLAHARTETSPA